MHEEDPAGPDPAGPRTRRRTVAPSRPLVPGPCALGITHPDGTPGEVVLERDLITIGSAPDNDVVLEDQEVSRHHLSLLRRPDGYLLEDLGSTNGTLVNGVQVQRSVLPTRAAIQVGSTRIRFTLRPPEGSVPESTRDRFGSVLGGSSSMRKLFGLLERIARSELTVMLEGETGTGKDTLAGSLHQASRRARGPFIVFDCSRVSKEFMESELFGHVKGAFTGALSERAGAFLQANQGTLFIDEVGELPLDLQPKLLRALEARTVKPLGSDREVRADVRVICATNRDLPGMVSRGTFREDLFFRLQGVRVMVPPLRQRREDIPVLLEHFLTGHRDRAPDLSFDPPLVTALMERTWPGNVRELRTMVDRLVALAVESRLTVEDLEAVDALGSGGAPAARVPAAAGISHVPGEITPVDQLEREAVIGALQATSGNQSEAARRLGISRSTLLRRMKSYGM